MAPLPDDEVDQVSSARRYLTNSTRGGPLWRRPRLLRGDTQRRDLDSDARVGSQSAEVASHLTDQPRQGRIGDTGTLGGESQTVTCGIGVEAEPCGQDARRDIEVELLAESRRAVMGPSGYVDAHAGVPRSKGRCWTPIETRPWTLLRSTALGRRMTCGPSSPRRSRVFGRTSITLRTSRGLLRPIRVVASTISWLWPRPEDGVILELQPLTGSGLAHPKV